MLVIEGRVRLLAGLLQRAQAEHFDIQPVRIARRSDVTEIIHTSSAVAPDHLIDQFGINQRAITRDPHDNVSLMCSGSLQITRHDILFVALNTGKTELAYTVSQRLVTCIHRRRHHNLIDLAGTRQARQQYLNHGYTADGLHYLVRQAGRAHASLDDCNGFHAVFHSAGLSNAGSVAPSSAGTGGQSPAAA